MLNTTRQSCQSLKLVSGSGFLIWVIPGSCDKLRSYRAGPYKIIKKLCPALAEVIEVYEKGKLRPAIIDIIKKFQGDSSSCSSSIAYGFPSHPQIYGMIEVPSLVQSDSKAVVSSRTGTSWYKDDITRENEDRSELKPFPENPSDINSGITEEVVSGEVEANRPPPFHLNRKQWHRYENA